ncbi:MAG: hypothetical protein IRZ05_13355 [Micromonosporaceae bacterium]|nr:hypothetical protein [Micromonosporaceae bacterium]
MTQPADPLAARDAIHAEAERVAVPNMDLVVTTLEGMVDALEALGRRGAHPWHHDRAATREHQTRS